MASLQRLGVVGDRPQLRDEVSSMVFFFQAEDGIRVKLVTGVQTWCSSDLAAVRAGITTVMLPERNKKDYEDVPEQARNRSEERRAGKEGRSRGSPYH